MRVLVTGANGHIGANTVRSLFKRGYEVVPFVRRNADMRGIKECGLPHAYGDVVDYDSLLVAIQGCEAVVHLAGVYLMWSKDPEKISQTACIGTKNIFMAAREAGVERLVFTSSMAAVGYSRDRNAIIAVDHWNETPKTAYYRAKTESECLALELSDDYNVPTVRLCPTFVLGPYDYRLTPSTKNIVDLINGKVPAWEGGSNYVHVEDVAEAHAEAIKKGEAGGRYIVGGKNLHLKELSAIIEGVTGVRPIYLGITGPLAELSGAVLGSIGALLGKEPPYDRAIVQDMVGWYGYFDCSETNQTFGLEPQSAEEVIQETVRWLLYLGVIKSKVANRISAKFPPSPDW